MARNKKVIIGRFVCDCREIAMHAQFSTVHEYINIAKHNNNNENNTQRKKNEGE